MYRSFYVYDSELSTFRTWVELSLVETPEATIKLQESSSEHVEVEPLV